MNHPIWTAFADEMEKVARHPFLAAPSAGGVLRAIGRGGAIGGLGMLGLGALASRDPEMMGEMGVPSSEVSTSGPDWDRVEAAKDARRTRLAGGEYLEQLEGSGLSRDPLAQSTTDAPADWLKGLRTRRSGVVNPIAISGEVPTNVYKHRWDRPMIVGVGSNTPSPLLPGLRAWTYGVKGGQTTRWLMDALNKE